MDRTGKIMIGGLALIVVGVMGEGVRETVHARHWCEAQHTITVQACTDHYTAMSQEWAQKQIDVQKAHVDYWVANGTTVDQDTYDAPLTVFQRR